MNSNINNTANLIEIKNKTLAVEEKIEKLITLVTRKRKISYERCNDYGDRSFNITITFDELNIEMFSDENVKLIKDLYREFVSLRKQQQPTERQYDTEQCIKNQMKSNIKLSV